ncbi:MAG: hypothetical protein RL338_399 [Chloroflexota bacterium]
MQQGVLLPALAAVLGAAFTVALLVQWRGRRRDFQLVWAIGVAAFALGAAVEALAAAGDWSPPLARIWYVSGAVATAGWLGLGTAFLLARTRFGYSFAFALALGGIVTIATGRRFEDAGALHLAYGLTAIALALVVATETYFAGSRWPRVGLVAIGGATVLAIALAATAPAATGSLVDGATGLPDASGFPTPLRLLVPFTNVVGAVTLVLGATFSAYEFMPKRRVLPYSLDPTQTGDQFLFNLLIAPVALAVNLVASLPGALRALLAGELNRRVPATILIAFGGLVPALADTAMSRLGEPAFHAAGLVAGIGLLFLGFVLATGTGRPEPGPAHRPADPTAA